MRVKVLFFGQLKDIVGCSEDAVDLPPAASLGDVFAHYASRFPKLEALRRSIVLARNQQFSTPDTILVEGDEVAFLPPVSGGTAKYSQVVEEPGIFVAITREPIEGQSVARHLLKGEDGAFVGACEFEQVGDVGRMETAYALARGLSFAFLGKVDDLADEARTQAIILVELGFRFARRLVTADIAIVGQDGAFVRQGLFAFVHRGPPWIVRRPGFP